MPRGVPKAGKRKPRRTKAQMQASQNPPDNTPKDVMIVKRRKLELQLKAAGKNERYLVGWRRGWDLAGKPSLTKN